MRKSLRFLWVLLLPALLPGSGEASDARVYRRVDVSGATHYSNIPATPNPFVSRGVKRAGNPSGVRLLIRSAARRYGVDPRLVEAIIAVESDFDPGAISPKGAKGLMQLMPETAIRYAVQNPFDPLENIAGGIRYLRDLLRRFPGDLRSVLAAYNAGETAVVKHRGVPPYRETRAYVSKVLRRYGRPGTLIRRYAPEVRIYRFSGNRGHIIFTNIPPRIALR